MRQVGSQRVCYFKKPRKWLINRSVPSDVDIVRGFLLQAELNYFHYLVYGFKMFGNSDCSVKEFI